MEQIKNGVTFCRVSLEIKPDKEVFVVVVFFLFVHQKDPAARMLIQSANCPATDSVRYNF